MNTTYRNLILLFVTLGLLGGALALVDLKKPETLDIGTFAQRVENNDVQEVTVDGDTLHVLLKDTKKVDVAKESTESLSELLRNVGVSPEKVRALKITVEQPSALVLLGEAVLPTLLPLLLVLGLMQLFFRQAQNQAQEMGNRTMAFGQSNAKETARDQQKEKVTFADVAGVKEAKQELQEVVEFLKQPEKFSRLGAKIPKGVLMMGSPGTGKTLLARAVAGEADVPFLHMSGSEFVEMFVGVGASRVRDLFERAKKAAPCIVFIDEIDAVGRQRGAGLGGSHDEREQTLNQILVAMDGFETNIGVIVIAATNRPDVLDPALLRPGRFDRRVVLDPPDMRDREEVLAIHAKGKPLAKDVNLRRIAERTPGFSGADLASLMNEAAILAARQNKQTISQAFIISSIEKVMLGPERKSHLMNDEERNVTAYHEAGHALIAHLSPHADAVHKISIVSRGRAAGYTIKLPIEDRTMRRSADYKEDLSVLLGGYVAEKVFFGDVTTGASNDMQNATKIAHDMVMKWGMSDVLGTRVYGEHADMIFLGREITENKDYSESRAELIDQEIDRLLKEAYQNATALITTHRDAMDKIAAYLMKHEMIEREEFEAIIGFPPANAKNTLKKKEKEA